MSASAATEIALLALDVDGVMTDGKIYYDSNGTETKAFNIKDGLGIKMLQAAGIEVAIITGRSSPMVERRAAELGIANLVQGREDKLTALQQLCDDKGLALSQCAYMGDDLPDLGAITAAGLGLSVADAVASTREAADWVSTVTGGNGAVREAAEYLLGQRGQLQQIIEQFS